MVLDCEKERDPQKIKDHLVSLARTLLPRQMGSKYARIVETCLTCLDEDNANFGDESEFQDEDDILIAVRYIEKVHLSSFQIRNFFLTIYRS